MKFLTLEQFTEMWKLQDQLNTVTSGPNWKELNQNWNLAIKSEVMEFFDYIGWKWWKEPSKTKKPSDMQARLELVDIWHFLLSDIIECSSIEAQFEWMRFENCVKVDLNSLQGCLDSVANLDNMEVSNSSKVTLLTDALQLCEWTWDELYKAYIGKVALNNFRQANGYKEGTYQKIWKKSFFEQEVINEFEDNWFLEKIMEDLERMQQLTYANVYKNLQVIYDRRDVI